MRVVAATAVAALALAGGAAAEVVAPGVHDGMLATAGGNSFVAYVRGRTLQIATRARTGGWRTQRAARVQRGSSVAAFVAGADGPAALVEGPAERTLLFVRARRGGWQTIRLVRRLPARVLLGWPGLALDQRGGAVVAYTRWRGRNHKSYLELTRIAASGRVRTERITLYGFPQSYVPPPAAPVVMPDGRVHVVESYGISGTLGTIEWIPTRRSWEGQFIDGGIGDTPVGPLLAGVGRRGTVYAAWTEFLGVSDQFPLTLAEHGSDIFSDFVLDRALTAALALTPQGPTVAANEWVSETDLGFDGDGVLWAGVVAGPHGARAQVDGPIAGLATSLGGRELLLSGRAGLSWYRTPRLATRVSLRGTVAGDGSVVLTGRVRGATDGTVAVYRERPGRLRQLVRRMPLGAGATFRVVDRGPAGAHVYRAVYVDRATGVPYAALLREPPR